VLGSAGLTPLSPADDHVNLSAAALGTDKPLAPIENGGVRAVSLRHLGRVGLNLMVTDPRRICDNNFPLGDTSAHAGQAVREHAALRSAPLRRDGASAFWGVLLTYPSTLSPGFLALIELTTLSPRLACPRAPLRSIRG